MTAWNLSRREALTNVGGGFATLALANLLLAEAGESPAGRDGVHHPAKARRVIQLFMNGGASQMDLFDYKPALEKKHGEKVDFGLKTAATSVPGAVMRSPFAFRQHGQSGRWVSSVLPNLASKVDELTFLMGMASKTNVHGPASYLQNTGFQAPGFPAFGAWVSHGLGRLTDELPTFVVLPDPRGLPYNNMGNFSAGFLSQSHAATVIKTGGDQPVPFLQPPASAKFLTPEAERASRALLAEMNQRHLSENPGDARLNARIESYELAAKMQLRAPEAFDIRRETPATRRLYGLDDPATATFGKSCLLARRLAERGVRFVQVWSGAGGPANNWDNHTDIPKELPAIARQVDLPIAGLLTDLRSRGLLDDTIVVWTTEFGRFPFTQGATGRDHNGGAFTSWLAGAGLKPGVAYGKTDDYSFQAVDNITYGYDLHATVLHLLGIDHERLFVRHNGINRRLTDVHGHILKDILA